MSDRLRKEDWRNCTECGEECRGSDSLCQNCSIAYINKVMAPYKRAMRNIYDLCE